MKTHLGEWMDHFELSVDELGEKSGISPKVITKWLEGKSTPSLVAINQISDTIGITIDDIVNNSPEQTMKVINNNHLIETTNIKIAVRLQNYFTSKAIENKIVVRLLDNEEVFIISYIADIPLDIKEVLRISKKRKYRDDRENSYDEDIRYTGIAISNL